MSPRAAWRLESLGYDAHDYAAGKADWLAYGLPHEGSAQLAGDALTTNVPTCGVQDRLGDVRGTLEASPLGIVAVLNTHGVLMGRLDHEAAHEEQDGMPVDRLMREGPTTIRPSEELGPLLERMRRAHVDAILVTSSDGRLRGLLERSRAEAVVA